MADDVKKEKPRSGKAALVWLLIFLFIGSLLIFRTPSGDKPRDLSQSEFEFQLVQNCVRQIAVTPESNRVLVIEGKLAAPAAAGKPAAASAAKPTAFRTRVLRSERMDAMLAKVPRMKVESGNDNWWALAISVLPEILVLIVIYIFTARQIRLSGRGAMDFGKSRARMIPPDQLKVKFDDIAGADEAKEEIQEVVDFLKDPLKFQMVGGRIPKGCLLVGPPGTGKTLIAKAVACEAGVPFFSISGSDFVEMFVGVGASRVRDMFDEARKNTPCLLFIDEIDAVGRSRFSGWGGGHDEREQTLNALLVEMDGLESNRSGVIVLAATNRPDVLDPALLRPGRFDRRIVMDLPDINGRRKILEVHVKNIRVDSSVDLDVIARTTPGFSGADLANLCNEAALMAARYDREAVTQQDMESARDNVCYGRERRSRKIVERDRRITAYHEAGHALVAMNCEHATPVHKVTIIPRGQAYLGATFMMPKEDVYTHSRNEMLDAMAVSMGGRAAEELIFHDITSGAAGDIEHLTHMARAMVCVYGMSDLGAVRYSDAHEQVHVRIDAPMPDQLGPETAREIDLAIRDLAKDAHDRAKAILQTNADKLEKLAQALLERETMDIAEIESLLEMKSACNRGEETPEAAEPAPETPGPEDHGTSV